MKKEDLLEFIAQMKDEIFFLVIMLAIAVIALVFYFVFSKNKKDIYLVWFFVVQYCFMLIWQLWFLSFEYSENKWFENAYVIIFITILAYIAIKSIFVIKANQMGLRITMGIPGEPVGSGPYIAIYPIQKIAIVPTELQSISFAANSVMTKRGRVKGYKDVIESAEVSVLFTLYYYFDKSELTTTVKKVSGFNEKDLAPELIPYVRDVLRTLIGRTPWRLINEERYKFAQCALGRIWPIGKEEKNYILEKYEVTEDGVIIEKNNSIKDDIKAGKGTSLFLYHFKRIEYGEKCWIKEEHLQKSPYVQFGLEKVAIAIEDIDFTDPELKKAISAPELSRLKKDAQKLDTDANRYTLEEEGAGAATARKKMIEVIQGAPELEVLYTLKEMAQGTSNTILFQIPAAFESKIKDMLGGNDFGSMFKLLKPEQQKEIKNIIEGAIKSAEK